MDLQHYLNIFQQCADQLDRQRFAENQLEIKTGIWLKSAVLKIQKPTWLNQTSAAKPFKESVFFSIWVNEKDIEERKLFYNIHALKMRQLTSYKIKSRDFAGAFRDRFKPFEQSWPNVSVAYGPLTLMEGWVDLDEDTLEKTISNLAYQFLDIHFIIDDLMQERRK